jgi:F0F1-type ATP synthase assembly protein I
MSATNKATVRISKVLWIHLTLTLILSVVLSVFNGIIGYSVLLGGLTYSLPARLALKRERVASKKETIDARQVLGWMYRNELLKLGLTTALLIMVFAFLRPIHSLALLVTYIGSHFLTTLLSVLID